MTDNLAPASYAPGEFGGYNFNACTASGECLTHCPYIPMDARKAKREIQRLREGRPSVVLEKCVGCMICTTKCPKECDPYALIRARWGERNRKKGLPAFAQFMMPHEFPNFRTVVRRTHAERRFLEKIAAPPDGDTILYTGCNTLLFSETLRSKIFDGLPIFGSYDACCGEMYYRMGLMDSARQAGEKLKRMLSGVRAKKVVFSCTACMNMVSNFLPNDLGVKFDFEAESLSAWLLRRVESGELELPNKLNRSVTLQDSCHAKVMAPEIAESHRKLLNAAGVDVVEMPMSKENSLCCGIAAGCSRFNPMDIAATGFKTLKETKKTGAPATATVCNGCQISLTMMRALGPMGVPPVVPLVQLIQEAAGETPDSRLPERRARQVLASIVRHAGPKMLSLKRFFMKPIQ